MDSEKQKLTVKIAIPLSDGDSSIFSGYLIGNETLITCRHGFTDFDSYNDQEPILVITQEDRYEIDIRESHNFKELIENKHILYESSKYDVVLFKCSSFQTDYSKIFLKEILSANVWEGGGYPSYNKDEKSEGYTDLDGKVINAAYTDYSVTLSVDMHLEDMEHWHEVSGSPIFINNQLAGLIYEYLEYKDEDGDSFEIQHQLRAVKLQYLWCKESKFREALEKLIPPPKSLDKLKELLDANPTLKQSLEEKLAPKKADLVEVIARKNKIELMELSLSLRADGVEQIEPFLLLALTSQYSDQECFKTGTGFYYEVPFYGDIPCEFSMAAEDNREPLFLPANAGAVKVGKFSLTSPPESGINSDAATDLANDITNKIATVEFINTRLSEDHPTKRKLNQKQIIIAAKNVLKKAKGSYYWKLEITPENSKIIEEVAKEFTSIKIIKLPEDTDLAIDIAENDLFEKFHIFIKGQK